MINIDSNIINTDFTKSIIFLICLIIVAVCLVTIGLILEAYKSKSNYATEVENARKKLYFIFWCGGISLISALIIKILL